MRVKVCGITRSEDALRAATLGVDAIGFNFVAGSPRYISPGAAAEIASLLPPFILRVGVFVDEPPDQLAQKAQAARLHCLQLHGDESPETCAASPLPWYKAHRVGEGFRLEEITRYDCGTFLLDGYESGRRGGTGRSFDWEVARAAARYGRVILAGGLSPDNVRQAIQTARPYAIDVNSGVESEPGIKDPSRLGDLLRQVSTT